MKKILLFVSLLASLISAQSFHIKQITNLNADCRNLSCGGYLGSVSYYTFEAHKGNSSSVYLGQYFPVADSFAVITQVIDDNFMNINPKLIYSNDSVFVLYQTNKNGNWDIAYRVYINNQLSPVYYVADSSADEINPVVSTIHDIWYSTQNQFVAFEKGNSVYIKDVHLPDTVATEIFHGDDSTKYSQVSLELIDAYYEFYIAARKVVNGNSFIVYKQYGYNGWGDEIVLANNGNCRSPKIHIITYKPCLSYTNDINGKSNIILIEELNQPIDTLKLSGYPLYDYDNFWDQSPLIATKIKDFYNYGFYTYTASRNDSLFIRLSKSDYNHQLDTMLYTKVYNNNLYLGNFGKYGGNGVYYTIWEDSISGNIQLFGRMEIYNIGAVNDKYSPSTFTLSQNYPNPFNPGTVINFKLLHRDKVTLNVYDIMGKQVCTLLNEDKPAGTYSINFDSKKYCLSSGIYFYRLITGGYSSVKKMILMK